MAKFEKVSRYADKEIVMPIRKTSQSAGYDLVAAEDYIIPSLWQMCEESKKIWSVEDDEFVTMDLMAQFTKQTGFKPTLVSTGMKCKLDPGTYLELSVRSSCPLKHWLMIRYVDIYDAALLSEWHCADCLLFAAIFLFMMVIPGHILNRKFNGKNDCVCSKS